MGIQRLVGLLLTATVGGACGGSSKPCTSCQSDDTTPPSITVNGTGGANRGSFSSSASDAQSSVTAQRLYLNNMLVRSGTNGNALSVNDTTLAPGEYNVRSEATSEGGTATGQKTFTVTAPAAPSIAPIAKATYDEDGSVTSTIAVANCTNPQYSLGAPSHPDYQPTLSGSQLTRKFAPDKSGNGIVAVNVACANGNLTTNAESEVIAQPDITFADNLGLKGETRVSPVTIELNGTQYQITKDTKIQAKNGANTWKLVKGQNGLMNYTGVKIAGQPLEVPLNSNLLQYTMNLDGADRTGNLIVFPNTYPEYSGASKAEVDIAYPTIPADTFSTILYRVLTKRQNVSGNDLGNETIAPGSQSYQWWRQAYDSLVVEDARAATLVGRAPRNFVFTDDTQQDAVWEPNANGVGFRPKAGSVFVFDRNGIVGGASQHRNTNGEVVSGTATANPFVGVSTRQHELGYWHDRATSDQAPTNNWTRESDNGPIISVSRRPFDENVLPFLHEKANYSLKLSGIGLIDYR